MAGKTLDELEDVVCCGPAFDSHLVTTCHRLRTKPLDEFTVEDLRIMMGQGIGLAHLIPKAVAILEQEPLAEGDYYPGDLLASVIGAVEWLQAQPEWLLRVVQVAERAVRALRQREGELRSRLVDFLATSGRTRDGR